MLVGYARVSTLGQSFDGQIEELQAAGCTKVFREKMSGVRSDRPQLRRLLKALGSGDVLVITRLDRLARSTRDLLNILEDVRQAGAGFRSLHDTWCDTSTPHGQLMLTVLGGLAEFERALTKARTGEGRKRARAAGVRFGRPFALTDHSRVRRYSDCSRAKPLQISRVPSTSRGRRSIGSATGTRPRRARRLKPRSNWTAGPRRPTTGQSISVSPMH
jgi:DNA invertase Pin-like site-specific DNA recombinase